MEEITKLRAWAEFLRQIRGFFDSHGFTEVTTPYLVPAGAFESTIDCLEARFASGCSELHSSPEFEMKAVLSSAAIPIYQIAKCFRDDPPTGIHKREFTMLEFYRTGCDYRATRRDIKDLFERLAGEALPFEEISMRDLFLRSTGLDLERLGTTQRLREAIDAKSLIHLSPEDHWEDLYFKLLIEKVEPSLDPACPTLVTDYPAVQSALAKLNPATGLAERFEVYWQGMELCNGCTELDDRSELKRRFRMESEARRRLGKRPHPYPVRLFNAMGEHSPSASGVAVGMDRLFRALTGAWPPG